MKLIQFTYVVYVKSVKHFILTEKAVVLVAVVHKEKLINSINIRSVQAKNSTGDVKVYTGFNVFSVYERNKLKHNNI